MGVAQDTGAAPLPLSAASSTTPLIRETQPADNENTLEKGKRKLLGLGQKREGADSEQELDQAGAPTRTMSPTSAPTLLPSPPLTDHRASPRGSPRMRPVGIGASPNRRSMHRSVSPGLHSPASSAIFERNVQEPEDSSAIPAHIKTEDHIPAALDASSLAITDDHLNPDEVEIVMHPAHQPAATAVAESMSDSMYSQSVAHEDSMASSYADTTEPASNYGSLDMTDPRRLSFISFADVVQAEHVEHDREAALGSTDALQFQSLSSAANRSPSPAKSPPSSFGMTTSPPTSGAASPRLLGSASPPLAAGEPPLQVETMRQALRKTRSGDLTAGRSQPMGDDSTADRPPFR